MAATFDAVGTTQSGTGITSVDIPITLGSGANRAVVVHFTGASSLTGLTATMNAGAETLTLIAGTDETTTVCAMLGKATALTGAQTVHVAWTTAQNVGVNALSFTGADQTTPFNNGNKTSNSPSPVSVIITSTNGDLTTSVTSRGASGLAVSTNQTSKWINNDQVTSGGDVGPGTGTTTHTWTLASSNLGVSGANVVAAAAAPPPAVGRMPSIRMVR